MREMLASLKGLSDETLIARVKECVSCERKATARLLAVLAELDCRRLYLGLGFSSLFSYCTDELHLSARAAYSRIEVARLSRRFPIVLRLIEDGSLSLTAVALLARHLTVENHRALLTQATHRPTREIEHLVAALCPQTERAAVVRRAPAFKPVVVVPAAPMSGLLWSAQPCRASVEQVPARPSKGAAMHSPAPAPVAAPAPACRAALTKAPNPPNSTSASTPAAALTEALASRPDQPPPPLEERYRAHVTISKQAHAELMRARDLLRHAVPSGDIGLVLERAISALVNDLERRKLARVARPREGGRSARTDTRNIPAAVRREVWRRDRARCAFVGPAGRCRERGFLELHHVVPFAAGGLATAANIELRCRAHNAHESQVYFGGVRAP